MKNKLMDEDRLLTFDEVRRYIPFSLNTVLKRAKYDERLKPKKFGRTRVWLYSNIQSIITDYKSGKEKV